MHGLPLRRGPGLHERQRRLPALERAPEVRLYHGEGPAAPFRNCVMAATTPSPNQSTRISMFDIHAFLRDLNKNPPTGANVDVNDLDSVWMPLISAKINASTVDFKALRRGLQDQCEDGGPEDLAVAEMIAVWMSEVPQSRRASRGTGSSGMAGPTMD